MDLSECRDVCQECHETCIEASIHFLVKGEVPDGEDRRDQVRLFWDCADVCQLSADLLSRGSDFHRETCRVCPIICEACFESCDGTDDPILKRCAEVCRDCAEHCRQMAGHEKGRPAEAESDLGAVPGHPS